jgi:hypothetical protein
MRTFKHINRWLLVFALVLANVPSSVLATLFAPLSSCSMPCCAPKAAIQVKVKACDSCPEEASQQLALLDNSAVNETHSEHKLDANDACGCKLAPAPTPEGKPGVAVLPSSSNQNLQLDILVPTPFRVTFCESNELRSPGIVGSDSGPPTKRPYCVCFGRAPPILVA